LAVKPERSCTICAAPGLSDEESPHCATCNRLLRWFRSYLADVPGLDLATITHETRFVEDLGVDSLDYVGWIGEAAVVFDVHISDEEAERMRTVADLLARIRRAGADWPEHMEIRIIKGRWWRRDFVVVDHSTTR
jgi:acyl carrier protein